MPETSSQVFLKKILKTKKGSGAKQLIF